DHQVPAQHGRDRVQLPCRDPVEDRLVGTDDAARLTTRLRRDRDVALVDAEIPPPYAATVDDVEPCRAARLPQERVVRARRELAEEGSGRVDSLGHVDT